jgi:hypothetical protein
MTETKCEWCPRDISKHNELALRICLLKAIKEKKGHGGLTNLPDIEASVELDKDKEVSTETEKKND